MLPRSRGGAKGKTIERRGRREIEQPKVGPKGELSGSERVNGVAKGGQPETTRAITNAIRKKQDQICSPAPPSIRGGLIHGENRGQQTLVLAFCACPRPCQIRG
jgi:hypothetical protein